MSHEARAIEPTVTVDRLGKSLPVPWSTARSKSRQASLRDALQCVLGRRGRQDRQAGANDGFWAFRNVSFQVNRGELVGLIGRHGAGKSTLLRVLGGVSPPTAGKAVVRGPVLYLPERTSEPNLELTAREHVFWTGTTLGMSRLAVARRFDALVDFAAIGPIMNSPFRRFSCGMHARLVLAMATHLDWGLLLVDEVLAMCDQPFRDDCVGRL